MRNQGFLWLVLGLVLIDAGLVAYSRLEVCARPALSVETIMVTRKAVEIVVPTLGVLESSRTSDIRSTITGRVSSWLVGEGDWVKSGDPLLTLDEASVKAELLKLGQKSLEARARWEEINRDAPRIAFLVKNGLMNDEQQGEYEARLSQAKAEMDSAVLAFQEAYRVVMGGEPPFSGADKVIAKADLSKSLTITSTVSGVVGPLLVKPGARVRSGQPLLQVSNLEHMVVKTGPIISNEQVKVGQPVVVTYADGGNDSFPGTVTAIIPAEGAQNGVRAVIEVDNHQRKLRPGGLVKVGITVFWKDSAVTIPARAVIQRQTPLGSEQPAVFVISSGRACLVPVELGRQCEGGDVIVEGLKEGSRVIVNSSRPLQELTDGVKVINKGVSHKADEPSAFCGQKNGVGLVKAQPEEKDVSGANLESPAKIPPQSAGSAAAPAPGDKPEQGGEQKLGSGADPAHKPGKKAKTGEKVPHLENKKTGPLQNKKAVSETMLDWDL